MYYQRRDKTRDLSLHANLLMPGFLHLLRQHNNALASNNSSLRHQAKDVPAGYEIIDADRRIPIGRFRSVCHSSLTCRKKVVNFRIM